MPTVPFRMNRLLLAREQGVLGSQDALAFERSMQFPAHFASKLSVEHTYEGHNGCVNRLGWNADGSLLVSGSDDRRAIIWHYPDVERPAIALTTEHRANIFGAQFLPCTGDRRIVTGAMDDTVQVHDLESSPSVLAGPADSVGRSGRQGTGGGGGGYMMHRRATPLNVRVVTPRTKVYLSHKDRVKDVKVEPMNPNNFWSAGEDGDIRQYDTRMPNQDKWESPTVFVQIRDGHRTVQVKSLDINKAHPHLMAVAGSDPYIRLYDRRKLGTGTWKRRGATPAVMLLAPPHLPLAAAARQGRAHATYVSFSSRGDKVVTTYHADHAYCFDITGAGDLAALFPQPAPAATWPMSRRLLTAPGSSRTDGWCCCGVEASIVGWRGAAHEEATSPGHAGSSKRGGRSGSSSGTPPLPLRAEVAKARGNTAIFERKWSAGVKAFSEALHFAPGVAVLYALRAEALLRRNWVGDAALALRDCDTAVALDPTCSRAFLSRIQALQELKQFQCALTAVEEYRRRFPGRAADDVTKLAAQLRASVDERRRLYEARWQQQEQRRVQRAAEALARTSRQSNLSPRRHVAAAPTQPQQRQQRTGDLPSVAGPSRQRYRRAAGLKRSAAGSEEAAMSLPGAVIGLPEPQQGQGQEAAGTGMELNRDMKRGCDAVGEGFVSTTSAAAVAEMTSGTRQNDAAQDGLQLPDCTVLAEGAFNDSEFASRNGFESALEHRGAVGGTVEPELPPSPSPSPSPPPVLDETAMMTAAADSKLDSPTLQEAYGGLEGVCKEQLEVKEEEDEEGGDAGTEDGMEAEAEGVVDGTRRHRSSDRELSDSENDDEEQVEDEDEEEDTGRGRSDSEYDDEAEVMSREGDGGEEDPDMELFLQFYARAMELAGSPSSSSGCSGADDPGVGQKVSNRCGGGGSGRQSWTGSVAPTARHVPGAWSGSPGGRRMLQRYVGQCNVQTDIKEVNFIGPDDRVVAAGSDCGRVFLYDADTGAVLRALPVDEEVANCVQCHPTLPVLATSGIENVIRLWSPRDTMPAAAAVSELEEELASVVEKNQARMREGPSIFRFRPSLLQDALQENPQLLHLFMSQLYGRGFVAGRSAGRTDGAAVRGTADPGQGTGEQDGAEDEDEEEGGHPEVSCRMA